MGFGHWMEVVEGDVRLRLGPIKRAEAVRFVAADAGFGLQSHEVTRFFGTSPSLATEEGELAWWDTAVKDPDHVLWGVYVPDGEDGWSLVGSTSIMFKGGDRRQAETGFLLFDRSLWGRRIASTAHLARTRYAFEQLDLLALTSAARVPNLGSNRALQGVGYVHTGVRYGSAFVDGRPIDTNQYLLPNPEAAAWTYFWRRPDDEIPKVFHDARPLAVAALKRAGAAVSFL